MKRLEALEKVERTLNRVHNTPDGETNARRQALRIIRAALAEGDWPEPVPVPENWNTPDTDGWHWLHSNSAGRFVIGRYHFIKDMWSVHPPSGGTFHLASGNMPRHFTYHGPIEEPASTAKGGPEE